MVWQTKILFQNPALAIAKAVVPNLNMNQIISIKFSNYKAFKSYSIKLSGFNILVGPNNAGKSSIIGALKILAEGIRKANARKPTFLRDINGKDIYGYDIDLSQVPVATENVFHNYDESEPAIISFSLSNKANINIIFPERGRCYLYVESEHFIVHSPKDFRDRVNVVIGFVPILGPVDHEEQLYQKEAARLALLTHKASRNFRNIWHHFPEEFEEFKQLVNETWPGMDISLPEINRSKLTPKLDMFCPEERIPREIYWAGFGFQVWCQMLTYLIKNKGCSLFLIDEPDIYLHSDLQRQLLNILKNLGPDIIIATHSTELISEADLNDILVINKTNRSAQRIKDPSKLQSVFSQLGSNLNPTLTQIAKTKRVVFVEGKDFNFFSKFARKLGLKDVANRASFAVVPIGGYQPSKLKAFKEGIEKTIGLDIISCVIFDSDYRSNNEINEIKVELEKDHSFVQIHSCKEIENFLLIPSALERTINRNIENHLKRSGNKIIINKGVNEIVEELSSSYRSNIFSQLQSHQYKFERSFYLNKSQDDSILTRNIFDEFEKNWNDMQSRLKIIPGKDFLSDINSYLQDNYRIGISNSQIIENIVRQEVPSEMVELLIKLDKFSKEKI